ncbi:MAG TPA: single-stranded-DNA-specific exonuclease RecJ [Anaerolineales bacterium]|nr:single-stranded-DNA-specific exonuclease RecJ [Anaerolineales bacterium]
MLQVWIEPDQVFVTEELAAEIGGHPLVAQLLIRRGIDTVAQARAFLDPAHYKPAPPESLPGLVDVGDRLVRALEAGETICVWGDFDVDGQTSTALLVEALTELGAGVFHHIPVRKTESHGMSVLKLEEVIARGADLVLTCDTGSGEHETIARARELGVDVVVTDHHKLAATFPPAAAFTNPQRLPDGHPLKTLPGAGVAWKLVEHLAGRLGKPGLPERGLDLAALGIVADVAELAGDTRWLLQRGIAALRENRRTGLGELYELAGIEPAAIDTETIGFAIAPRLNALGRLGDANPVVEFLTTSDATRARVMAERLEGLNGERKLITEQIYAGALAVIERAPELAAGPVLVLSREGWEPGVIGIAANRLAEAFGKPAVLISVDPDGFGRGSARSVAGVDITAAIAAAGDLLESFGGHTMAGGLSIRADRVDEFRRRISAAVKEQVPGGITVEPLSIDGYLELDEIDITMISDLERAGPFGPGSPRPVLASRDLEVRSSRGIGRSGDHLRLVVADRDENVQEVLWWGGGETEPPAGWFDLAYTLGSNVFKGERRVQVTWLAAREIEPGLGDRRKGEVGGPVVTDLRQADDPARELEKLRARGGLVVWGKEGEPGFGSQEVAGDRPILAVWTTPAGPDVLPGLIERLDPREVALFGNPPPDRDRAALLQHLAGLLNYTVRAYEGTIHIERLIAAARQSRAVVEAALDYLDARGLFKIGIRGDEIQVQEGSGEPGPSVEASDLRLQRVLEEAAAFTRFFLTAAPDQLLKK